MPITGCSLLTLFKILEENLRKTILYWAFHCSGCLKKNWTARFGAPSQVNLIPKIQQIAPKKEEDNIFWNKRFIGKHSITIMLCSYRQEQWNSFLDGCSEKTTFGLAKDATARGREEDGKDGKRLNQFLQYDHGEWVAERMLLSGRCPDSDIRAATPCDLSACIGGKARGG